MAGIDDDLHPEDATLLLRLVELYEGNDPGSRRQLSDPSAWETIIGPQIEDAAKTLRTSGYRRVVVRGQMRIPMWFAIGAALRHARGFNVATYHHGTIWSSASATSAPIAPHAESVSTNQGSEVALALCVAANVTAAVREYIAKQNLPVSNLVALLPPNGAGPESVTDGVTAARLAVGMRDAMRTYLDSQPAARVHLFVAAPAGLALLFGHRWNAVPPATIYEYLGAGAGYTATVRVTG